MKPLTKNPDREAIDAQVAEFFARGGKITEAERRNCSMPYIGSPTQARALMRTVAQIASQLRMSPEKLSLMLKEPTAPQTYTYEGEVVYNAEQVKKWVSDYRRAK